MQVKTVRDAASISARSRAGGRRDRWRRRWSSAESSGALAEVAAGEGEQDLMTSPALQVTRLSSR
jgi:hypothetical protein